MKFIVIAATLATASSTRFAADSDAGKRLLKSAKVIEKPNFARHLEDYNNEDIEVEGLGGLFIKYLGCSSFVDYNNYNNAVRNYNGYNNYQEAEEENEAYNDQNRYWNNVDVTNLVRFSLCWDQYCDACSGEYAVDMMDFLEAYNEHQMTYDEYTCNEIREKCYCYYGEQEDCYKYCYKQAGVYDKCAQFEGEDAFLLEDYLQCQQMEYFPSNYAGYQNAQQNGQQGYYDAEGAENAQNGYYYYLGPYCKDAQGIYLGAFHDNQCTNPSSVSAFSSANYGSTFPYFKDPIIAADECISCMDEDEKWEKDQQNKYQQQFQNGNYNNPYGGQGYQNYRNQRYNYNQQQQQDEEAGDANELCQLGMDYSIKCDEYVGYSSGCNFLKNTLPEVDGRNMATIANYLESIEENENVAFFLGAIAAVVATAVTVICCCGRKKPDSVSKTINLLETERGYGVSSEVDEPSVRVENR